MKSKSYYGKMINTSKLDNHSYDFYPDDYDFPCYKFNLPELKDYCERCFFTVDVYVDSDEKIVKIEKDKDIFTTNYIVKRLPDDLEYEADKILSELTTF